MVTPVARRHYDRLQQSRKELPESAIMKSAIVPQQIVSQQSGWDVLGENLLMAAANSADGIRPWGTAVSLRDRQLRSFLTQEPFTLGSITNIIARNAGLSWNLEGPAAMVERVQDVFQTAEFGQGWESFQIKVGFDYQCQDKGGIAELVRDEDDPRSPVIGLNHLDAARCWHTGNPQYPVLYQDRLGRWHAMKWYQCLILPEMPAPHETLYGQQYSSLTRVLVVSQILRNVLFLHEEKTGGRWTSSVKIVSGVKRNEIETAMTAAQELASSMGLMRYAKPAFLTTMDPNAEPKLLELDLAKVPEGFEIDKNFQWYITALALGLLVDYGELAPLPGRGIGTSSQSEQMHKKGRAKGIAIWTNRWEHAINFFGVVPRNVTFRYEDKDLDEDAARGTVFLAYAQAIQALSGVGGMDGQAATEILLDVGLLPQDIFDSLSKRLAKAAEVTSTPTSQIQVDDNQSAQASSQGNSRGVNVDVQDGSRLDPNEGRTQVGERAMTGKLDVERAVVEEGMTAEAHRALSALGKSIRHRIDPGSKELSYDGPRTFAMSGRKAGEGQKAVFEVNIPPAQVNIDLSPVTREVRGLRDELRNQKPPVVNVEAPVVNVPETVVNIPAPIVNIPEQPAPIVNVTTPARTWTSEKHFERDSSGRIVSPTREVITEEEAQS